MKKSLQIFQDKKIRSHWNGTEKQWYFSVVDAVEVLTDSTDPKQYIRRIKQRDEGLRNNWGTICTPLEMIAKDGKKRKIMMANARGIFRIIQSIPSKKAEPFKLWLAKVGHERIQEIEDPELAQERMKKIYEQKGCSKGWIDKRLRGVAIRQNLTDEWKERGITAQDDYAILTAEISRATFGMTPNEYRKHKNLPEKSEGITENKSVAKRGGTVAGNA